MVILGIDPGLNITGYGAIEASGQQIRFLAAGDIRPPSRQPLPQRLSFLYDALSQLVARAQPQTIVLEMVFTHSRYVHTAAKMAHARGVACLVAQQHRVTLVEHSPARVKKALTGCGGASKDQVAKMVAQWIGVRDTGWSFDASDALALAIAHVHMQGQLHLASHQKGSFVQSSELRVESAIHPQSKIKNPKSKIAMARGNCI